MGESVLNPYLGLRNFTFLNLGFHEVVIIFSFTQFSD